MEEEKEKLKFFSVDALVGLLVKAGADVESILDLNKEQLIDLCLVAKGFKAGVFPKKVVKEMTMVEMMQMMMEREEKQRELMVEREEKVRKEQMEMMVEREEKVRKEQMEMMMEREEKMRTEQREIMLARQEKEEEKEEERRQEQREWQAKLLSSQNLGQEKARDEAKKERERRTKEEESTGARIKKFGDILKNVLPKMPTEDIELPLYLESIESLFAMYLVPEDLKCALLMPFLSEKAKKLIRRLPVDQLNTYVKLKVALLREFRLTPQQYKGQFMKAEKLASESWMQFATRLRTYLRFYLESREVDNFQRLQDLWVSDKMKECMPYVIRSHVIAKESDAWLEPIKLAEITDIFSINLSEYHHLKDTEFKFASKSGEGKSFPKTQKEFKEFEKKPNFSKFDVKGTGDSFGGFKGNVSGKSEKPKCFLCLSDQHLKAACPRNKAKSKPFEARVNYVDVEGEVREANVCLVKCDEVRKDDAWFEREGFCNSWEVKYGPYDYCKEPVYGLEERDVELKGLRAKKKQEDVVEMELNSLFEYDTLNVFAEHVVSAENVVAVNSCVTLSSIPRVRLQIGKVMCTAIVDSGSEITVVNKRMLQQGDGGCQPVGKVKLRGAFGVQSDADLMHLPCVLTSDEGQNNKLSVLLTCAVTDELMSDMECLLTLDDYQALKQSQEFDASAIEIDKGQTSDLLTDTELCTGGSDDLYMTHVLQVEDTSDSGTSTVEEDTGGVPMMDMSGATAVDQSTVGSDDLDETSQLVKAAEQLRMEQLVDEGLKECWAKGNDKRKYLVVNGKLNRSTMSKKSTLKSFDPSGDTLPVNIININKPRPNLKRHRKTEASDAEYGGKTRCLKSNGSEVIDQLNDFPENEELLDSEAEEEEGDIQDLGTCSKVDDDEDVNTDSETHSEADIQNICEKDEVQGVSQLHLAAECGDTDTVRSLLMSTADVDVLDAKHNTPLHYATLNGHADVVILLLSSNASVNSRNVLCLTSLHLSSKNGHLATVQLLLNSNANVNAVSRCQSTPLHFAATNGHADIVQNLILNGADVNSCNNAKMTALHLASQNGHVSIVEILLDHHATVDVMMQSDETPFYLAAKNGHAGVTDMLLSRGVCDFVIPKTPLHVAFYRGHIAVIEVILKHSSRISESLVNDRQKHKDAENDLRETSGIQPIQLLRDDGRRVSAGLVWTEINEPLEMWRNLEKDTALELAVRSNQPKIVHFLLNELKCTYSEEHIRKSLVRLIFGDYRNHKDAAKIRSDDEHKEIFSEIAQSLIKANKFNVNHRDVFGYTVLHNAMKYIYGLHGKPDRRMQVINLIQLLFEKGADVNLKNRYEETPLSIAVAEVYCLEMQTMFDLEEKSGMKLELNARNAYGKTVLIEAAERNQLSMMRLLLDHKASVNSYDYCGFTALHKVCYKPNTSWFDFYFFCKWLLELNLDGFTSLETSSWHKLRLGGENIDPLTFIQRLQRRLQNNEKIIRRREAAVKLLLDNEEINVNAINFRGDTPLDLAMKSSKRVNWSILNTLKNRGAIQKSQEPEDLAPIEVARIDNRGRNPLHRLIISGISVFPVDHERESKEEEVNFDFMINGIMMSPRNFKELATATDNKGRTPLHYAAIEESYNNFHKYREPMRMLLKIGSEVNAVDIYGKTPLHYAETDDHYKLLVQSRADEDMNDNFGNTPRYLKQLRDLVDINKKGLWCCTNTDLYQAIDIAQVFNTNHVTELTRKKLVKAIRIYSQSPHPQESSEEAIWRKWRENEFNRLNRRLNQLTPAVKHFIERLADGIKEKDWRFECQPILVGSAEEKTKVVISADFDFNFRLIKFSQLFDPFPHPLGPSGYFELRRKANKNSRNNEMFDSFFNKDGILLTDEVNSRFQILLEEVINNPDLWQDEHLFDWNTKHIYNNKYGWIRSGLCMTLLLRMIHPIDDGEGGFLFVKISIDIVACVHVKDWWPEDALPAVKTDGCTFVFDRPGGKACKPRDTRFLFAETYARISFAQIESRIIKESSPLRKAAYIICKMILYHQDKTTYQLKTSLFFCMKAFNAKNKCEAKNEEKITREQLVFWVERLMFCFMEFSRRIIYPCFFMPSFRQQAIYQPGSSLTSLKKRDDKNSWNSKDLRDFSYHSVHGLYLDLCPDGSTFDIPTKELIDHRYYHRSTLNPNDGPIWDQTELDELFEKLSSRSSR